MRRQLETTNDEFDALHRAVDKVKHKSGASVRLPRDAVMHLLLDHSAMLRMLGGDVQSPGDAT